MKRTKHRLFVFPPKKTLIWRRHCSIGQSCCSMTSKRFLESSLNQPKARCVCIRSINQSNCCISVRLLFLFCSRVFISRSYENLWVVLFIYIICIRAWGFSLPQGWSSNRGLYSLCSHLQNQMFPESLKPTQYWWHPRYQKVNEMKLTTRRMVNVHCNH